MISDRLPGHEIAFQKSGHAKYIEGFLEYFERTNDEIVVITPRPRVDFISIGATDLPYRVRSRALRAVRGRLVLADLESLRATLTWYIYARLPRRLQALAVGARLRARRLQGFAHQLGSFLSAEEMQFVQRAAAAEKPDLVLYDGVFNVCGKIGDAEHWVITHEVKHQRCASFEAQNVPVRPADFNRDVECRVLASIGKVIAIQWDDALEFRRMLPDAQTVVVPVSFTLPMEVSGASRGALDCIFVGSGSLHNVDGIEWFLRSCWPAIKDVLPAATLRIYGSICQRLGVVPSGVEVCGTVDDLAPAYARASLALVPLRIGSGLKVKLVEALAHGVPVVTTSVGVQGLAHVMPPPCEIADSANDFVLRCLELLQSSKKRDVLARTGRACAERFAPSAAFAEFDAALRAREHRT